MRMNIEAERESLRRERRASCRSASRARGPAIAGNARRLAERDAVSLARGCRKRRRRSTRSKANVKERNELDAEKHRFERMRREVREKREELKRSQKAQTIRRGGP